MNTTSIPRRRFLAAPAAAPLAQAAAGRSVLLMIGDDLSPGYLGCYGNALVRTPNIDRLAREGVRFTHAFCTTASCSASRSVILTGLHNHSNGQYGHAHLPYNFHTLASLQSMPKLVRARDGVTGVLAKLHVNPPQVYPWDFEREKVPHFGEATAQFLKTTAGRPFYLHVGFHEPHRAAKGFGNERAAAGVTQRKYSAADVTVPKWLPDRPEVRAEIAEYMGAVDRLDQRVGHVLEALEASGRANDTLVAFISDNGLPFPGAKASFYDSGNCMPCIVRHASLARRGIPNDALVHWPDLVPTFLEWMGLPAPPYPLHGRSFLPVLEQSHPEGWDEIYLSHTFHELNNYYPYRAIRTRRWKYVQFLYPELEMPLPSDLFSSPTWYGILHRRDTMMGVRKTAAFLRHEAEELYDLEQDPLETTNVARQHAAVVADLRAKVYGFRERTTDPWLIVDRQREVVRTARGR